MAALIQYLGQYSDDPTLIAHWALDETEGASAIDSASGNVGFVMGDPTWQPNGGQVNGAIQLDGIDDAIIGPPPLNPSAGPFSAIAWVKGGAPGQAIISEPGGSNWLSLDLVEGRLMTEFAGFDRSSGPLFSEITISDDQWHRIAFVWDGS